MVGGVSVGGCKIVVMSSGGILGLTPSVLAKSFRMRCSADGVVENQRRMDRGLNWLKSIKRYILFTW